MIRFKYYLHTTLCFLRLKKRSSISYIEIDYHRLQVEKILKQTSKKYRGKK